MSVRPLFPLSEAHIWPPWSRTNLAFPRPPERCLDGSVDRQDRLAGAGGGVFRVRRLLAKDDGAHREASVWAGRGAEALGLSGPVDPEAFRRVLEGEVSRNGPGAGPGGRRLGRKELDGGIT